MRVQVKRACPVSRGRLVGQCASVGEAMVLQLTRDLSNVGISVHKDETFRKCLTHDVLGAARKYLLDHGLGVGEVHEVSIDTYSPPAAMGEVYMAVRAAVSCFLSELDTPKEYYSPSIVGRDPSARGSGGQAEWLCELPLGSSDFIAVVPLMDMSFIVAPCSVAVVGSWLEYRSRGMPELDISSMLYPGLMAKNAVRLVAGNILFLAGNTFHKGALPHDSGTQVYLKFYIGTPQRLKNCPKPRDLSESFQLKFYD
ncbi:hypothetical protein VOLCADRAFT_96950 [Volvox carteri f. nagariensis]|uniref:Uncharacterized protein n=1 Tax=Volvox carteri f. nagariensis TaxID=3068 RepID=D8UBE4_VOLCA|nr:uncharacterized protein VOLCADRAFT_96950 [Volvox carteri f. nagariensis]EFJ42988.1 hypothetical protein VOLCADRAFT_96950 [Volvox carteri f. nagariensis]|eukprot:XP_002956028.1 hypothetical protein VOLCADRAFT_96950 [Volvox carteri f. nagariensis]